MIYGRCAALGAVRDAAAHGSIFSGAAGLGFFFAPINVTIVSLFLSFFSFLAVFPAAALARRKGLEREMSGAELGRGERKSSECQGDKNN